MRCALVLLFVVTSACSSSADADKAVNTSEPSLRSQLAEAKATWADADVDSYRLELQELRNYWTRGCRWASVTEDGKTAPDNVRDSTELDSCFDVAWTVELLHTSVDRMLDDLEEFSDPVFGEHTLEVSFNDDGVPTTIEFDMANGADEESLLQVVFTPLP